jgi:hypothetical protein
MSPEYAAALRILKDQVALRELDLSDPQLAPLKDRTWDQIVDAWQDPQMKQWIDNARLGSVTLEQAAKGLALSNRLEKDNLHKAFAGETTEVSETSHPEIFHFLRQPSVADPYKPLPAVRIVQNDIPQIAYSTPTLTDPPGTKSYIIMTTGFMKERTPEEIQAHIAEYVALMQSGYPDDLAARRKTYLDADRRVAGILGKGAVEADLHRQEDDDRARRKRLRATLPSEAERNLAKIGDALYDLLIAGQPEVSERIRALDTPPLQAGLAAGPPTKP